MKIDDLVLLVFIGPIAQQLGEHLDVLPLGVLKSARSEHSFPSAAILTRARTGSSTA
jgi:hypothetical protein